MPPSTTRTLVRAIGEPVRLSADLVLTVVAVQAQHVRLRISAPEDASVGAPVLVSPSSAKRLSVPVGTPLAVAERALVEATLKACQGSKPRAAASLGCSLKGLYNKLDHYARMDGTKTTGAKRPGRGTRPSMEEGPVETAP